MEEQKPEWQKEKKGMKKRCIKWKRRKKWIKKRKEDEEEKGR